MEVKVGKVELSVTNNGTPKVNIYPEGSDFENIAESIEIIGEESIYAMTRKAGDVINIIEKGKWKKCSRCGQIKLAHNKYFSKNKTSKDGFYSICKNCRNNKK